MLRPLRQKYRNTVEKYEKYAQIPVSLVGFILKRSGICLTQPVQIRDNHHRQEGRESRQDDKNDKYKKKTEIHKDKKTNTHTQIQKNTKYTITKKIQTQKVKCSEFASQVFGGKSCLRYQMISPLLEVRFKV